MDRFECIDKKHLQHCELLGQGHYGKVERYIDTRNNRDLAVKYCIKGTDCTVDNQKLKKEAERVSNFHHDNIIRLYGMVFDEGVFVSVAYEFMPGGNLANAIKRLKNAGKHLPWSLKCRLMTEVSQAVSYMHSKDYIHKDIKGNNILLNAEFHAKLADFELSRQEQTANVAATRLNYATLSHVAPEYLKDVEKMQKYDTSIDVYSFGITMFEIMAEDEDIYPNMNHPLMVSAVGAGERPDVSLISLDRAGRTVTAAVIKQTLIPLMEQCWSQSPERRPLSRVVADKLSTVYNKDVQTEAQSDAVWCATDAMIPRRSGSHFVSDGGQRGNAPAAVIPPATIINNPGNVNIGTSHTAVYGGGGLQPRPRTWVQLSDEEAEQKLDLRANAIVLQDEEANVSDDHLRKIAKFLGNDTKWLARCLLFKEGEVQAIEYDNQIHGLEEINMQMLLKWKARTNTPSYKWLATACLSLNRTDLTNILVQEV